MNVPKYNSSSEVAPVSVRDERGFILIAFSVDVNRSIQRTAVAAR